jgi:polysaccharide export outer membrane protein
MRERQSKNRMRTWFLLAWVLAVPALANAQETLIGPGDVVAVSVYGQDDLRTTTSVSSDGNISLPLLGTVQVAGLTARQAESRIAAELARRNLVRDPQVTVLIERSRAAEADLVTILGNVSRPGRYPVKATSDAEPVTVASLVALAGGLTDKAGDVLVLTRQVGEENRTIRINLSELFEGGDLSRNFELLQGDIAYVPEMEEFFVYGEVRNPGVYRLRPGMTVIQALSAGGGLTARASEKGISITRVGADGRPQSLKVGMNDQLQANDVVIVKEGLF